MPRAAAVVLCALLALTASSCVGPPPMTEQQQAEHSQALEAAVEAEGRAAQAQARLDDALGRAIELELRLGELESAPAGTVDVDQVALLGDELERLSVEILAERDAKAQADADRGQALDVAADVEVQAAQDLGGTIMGIVGDVFPPAKGLSDAWLLLGGLLFKRPREHLTRAVSETVETAGKALAQNPMRTLADLRNVGRSVGAAVGLKHTTDDPAQLVANAARKAAKAGVGLEQLLELAAHAHPSKPEPTPPVSAS